VVRIWFRLGVELGFVYCRDWTDTSVLCIYMIVAVVYLVTDTLCINLN